MDWLSVVSLVAGGASIALAITAIAVSLITYDRTKGVLTEVDKKAAVIEEMVKGTQSKLVEAVIEIAAPAKETAQEKALAEALPELLKNPDGLKQLMEVANTANNMPGSQSGGSEAGSTRRERRSKGK